MLPFVGKQMLQSVNDTSYSAPMLELNACTALCYNLCVCVFCEVTSGM